MLERHPPSRLDSESNHHGGRLCSKYTGHLVPFCSTHKHQFQTGQQYFWSEKWDLSRGETTSFWPFKMWTGVDFSFLSQSLGFAASVPAAWLLLTLLVLLTYLLSRCCDKQLQQGRSLYCHRWVLGITAFLCRYCKNQLSRLFFISNPSFMTVVWLLSVCTATMMFTMQWCASVVPFIPSSTTLKLFGIRVLCWQPVWRPRVSLWRNTWPK